MKQFIIGRNGNQPFKIEAEGVSAEHARITISDNGEWTLEDLKSANGTFVRDDAGNFIRIVKTHITEQTVIRLASVSAVGHKSYTFMAHHVLAKNPDDYGYEFNLLYQQLEKQKQDEAALDQKMQRYRMVGIVAPIVGFAISCIPPFSSSMGAVRMSMLVPPMLVNLLTYGMQSKPKELRSLRAVTIVCPKCGRPLSDYDVNNRRCSLCKAE